MVLAARCRGHGGQLAHGGEDAEVADPDDEETVDDACGAAIVETLGEEDCDGFPSDEDGATEAKDRHKPEITLQYTGSWLATATRYVERACL